MPEDTFIWHGVYAEGKAYTRSSWRALKSWHNNPIVDSKSGMRYREKHPDEPVLYVIPLPGKFMRMIADRVELILLKLEYRIDKKEFDMRYMNEKEMAKATAKVVEMQEKVIEIEFTYGQAGKDVHAISLTHPPDTFSKRTGRRIVEDRLKWAQNTRKERNFTEYLKIPPRPEFHAKSK